MVGASGEDRAHGSEVMVGMERRNGCVISKSWARAHVSNRRCGVGIERERCFYNGGWRRPFGWLIPLNSLRIEANVKPNRA